MISLWRVWGMPGLYTYYVPEWANVSVTPWKYFKGVVNEGGIRSPLPVRGPHIPAGGINADLGHSADIAPTLYELVGFEPGSSLLFNGKLLPHGSSLLSSWLGDSRFDNRILNIEFLDSKAVRKSKWKASFRYVPIGSGHWELYDMNQDLGA